MNRREDPNMKITKLRLERLKRDLSQNQVSIMTGLPPIRISLLERGLPPQAKDIEALTKVFGLPPEELFQN